MLLLVVVVMVVVMVVVVMVLPKIYTNIACGSIYQYSLFVHGSLHFTNNGPSAVGFILYSPSPSSSIFACINIPFWSRHEKFLFL